MDLARLQQLTIHTKVGIEVFGRCLLWTAVGTFERGGIEREKPLSGWAPDCRVDLSIDAETYPLGVPWRGMGLGSYLLKSQTALDLVWDSFLLLALAKVKVEATAIIWEGQMEI